MTNESLHDTHTLKREARIVAILMGQAEPKDHSQRCPVWTERMFKRSRPECHCWIKADAERLACLIGSDRALFDDR